MPENIILHMIFKLCLFIVTYFTIGFAFSFILGIMYFLCLYVKEKIILRK